MIPVLIDCDTGIDDALALLYLAALHHEGEVNLVGATTTAGNVDVKSPRLALFSTRIYEEATAENQKARCVKHQEHRLESEISSNGE